MSEAESRNYAFEQGHGDAMHWESDMKNDTKEVVADKWTVEAENDIPQEVAEHVRQNVVEANDTLRKCVDGGYRDGEAEGALARAGGDLGTSMALLKLGFAPQEAFDLVFNFLKEKGQKYCWHSDTHADPVEEAQHEHHHDKPIVGCGHCNAAISMGGKYGVNGEAVQDLLNIVKDKQESNPEDMECVVLDREHQEEGILVTTSKEYSVKPWDQKNNHQFFIYDKVRDDEYLAEVYTAIKDKIGDTQLTLEDLMNAFKEQTNATLGLLKSSQGKPMYLVEFNGQTIHIKRAGNAPVDA